MKKLHLLFALLASFSTLCAQKVKLKGSTLFVDGQAIAKIQESKKGLLSMKHFTVTNMEDETLIYAKYTDAIPEDPDDNTIFF